MSKKSRTDIINIIINNIREKWEIYEDIPIDTDLKAFGFESLDIIYLLCNVEDELEITINNIFLYCDICTIKKMANTIYQYVMSGDKSYVIR